ncbi:hypothetical protein HYD_2170 [Candidatus Hydrogenosomobacter endosymbioticus]|uniref:Uncharacterized protein n=1 Tax=Candidatus Hydrogenosomobacter endosymbioticus TaxID=2558174 RepID=A0ABM7V8H4_9PROT|nr:hypothetical protein HYD_2170 [Candidatus Hydrogenosomobacter endosymbioticus]
MYNRRISDNSYYATHYNLSPSYLLFSRYKKGASARGKSMTDGLQVTSAAELTPAVYAMQR